MDKHLIEGSETQQKKLMQGEKGNAENAHSVPHLH